MKRAAVLALLSVIPSVLIAPPPAAAQIVNTERTQGPGGPGQGGPPRDRPPAQTGTAVVRGRVLAADTGRPLRRARITLQAPELGGDPRTTSTNVEGKYEIKDLPAGRYNVIVARSGYLQLRYGQRRPFEAGKVLQVAAKQVADNVDFTLPRMSLITGRVFDEAGEAISGVRVFALRSVYFEGKRRLLPVPGAPPALTDDAGQYRILGLTPGGYYVRAETRETWTVTERGADQVMAYAPTYFPGTNGVTNARRITLTLAQEANNTDFALIPGRAAAVSGTAVDSQGRPLVGRQVTLTQALRAPGGMVMMSMFGGTSVAADGTFKMPSVPPGEYNLQVRTTTDIAGTSVQETGTAPIVVNDVDLDNISIQTSAGWSAAGQIITEDGSVPSLARDRIRITPRPVNADLNPPVPPGPGGLDSGRVKDDWTFTVSGVYGPARLRVDLPDGWVVKTVLQDGRDLADAVFETRSGETLSGIQVVISNRVNSVGGQLTDDKNAPIADGTVIVFASNADKWSEDSRFVRSARPDQDGKYQIRGLPPGEYLAVAIDYVEDGMWNDPEYLESIRRYGHTITLGETDAQTVALKLVTP